MIAIIFVPRTNTFASMNLQQQYMTVRPTLIYSHPQAHTHTHWSSADITQQLPHAILDPKLSRDIKMKNVGIWNRFYNHK